MDVIPSIQPGEELQITRDLATSPGIIMQVHASLDVCFADIQRIRDLEATSLCQLAELGSPTGSPKMMPASPMVMSPKRRSDSTQVGEDCGFELEMIELYPSNERELTSGDRDLSVCL